MKIILEGSELEEALETIDDMADAIGKSHYKHCSQQR